MHLSTAIGTILACLVVSVMLVRGRAESPVITRSTERPNALAGVPWILIVHPVILFFGVVAYFGSWDMSGSGIAGSAAWGILWPVAVELSSDGHPYRVVRLLRAYLKNQFVFPLTKEHRAYRRKMKPLRPTEVKLFLLIIPVTAAGILLSSLFA